jgi:hypothetical protein
LIPEDATVEAEAPEGETEEPTVSEEGPTAPAPREDEEAAVIVSDPQVVEVPAQGGSGETERLEPNPRAAVARVVVVSIAALAILVGIAVRETTEDVPFAVLAWVLTTLIGLGLGRMIKTKIN